MKKKPSDLVPISTIPVINSIPKPDVPALLTALPGADIRDLKQQWRNLFGSEAPPYNRRFLESRLAYRIQKLAYGGIKLGIIKHLEELGQ